MAPQVRRLPQKLLLLPFLGLADDDATLLTMIRMTMSGTLAPNAFKHSYVIVSISTMAIAANVKAYAYRFYYCGCCY